MRETLERGDISQSEQITVTEAMVVAANGPGEKARGGRDWTEAIEKCEGVAPHKGWRWWAALTSAVIAVGIGLLWGYPGLLRTQTGKYEEVALDNYQGGRFEEALQACDVLENKSPDSLLPDLIRGNVLLRRGNLQAAEEAYRGALRAGQGTASQRAEAMMGLGRVLSLGDEPEAALEQYRLATVAAPESTSGYLSQALLLEERGNLDQALSLLSEAQSRAPGDPMIAALADETRDRVAFAQDREKRERVDRMVKELVEKIGSHQTPTPTDGWTSLPLTMWAMDLKKQGTSMQEGQDRLLLAGTVGRMIENVRVRVVERALFDKLTEELKLGTSQLVDRSTALSLGRLLAARLILLGEVIFSEGQTQLTMRLVETETGLIAASMTESFAGLAETSGMVKSLAEGLLRRIDELYPLRGKVTRCQDEEVWLNIGASVGVKEGQVFKVVDGAATLKVTSVQPETSVSKLSAPEMDVEEGEGVQIVLPEDPGT